jgi:hypothetical protein
MKWLGKPDQQHSRRVIPSEIGERIEMAQRLGFDAGEPLATSAAHLAGAVASLPLALT